MNPASVSDTIVQEITINGSANRIFDALTDPDQRVKWWGAEGRFQATHMESDLRPGGAWLMRGTGMGGKPFIVHGEYRAIDRPRLMARYSPCTMNGLPPMPVPRISQAPPGRRSDSMCVAWNLPSAPHHFT